MPLLVAAARALRDGWYPIGDNAFFALRARDVLGEHHPLLGTWTSASLTVGTDINNPGPLFFDLLAAPAKVDIATGTVVAVVGMHIASVVLGVHWARRVAGPAGAWAAAVGFLALAWAMGNELLVEPWQPHSLLFPFLAFLLLTWAVAAGKVDALPWSAALASMILQTHLSYALIIPVLAAGSVVALVVGEVRSDRPDVWSRLKRPSLVTLGVVAVAWAQPLYDQVAGQGNLRAVASNGAGGAETAGLRFAARVMATVGAVPGGWAPGGFEALRLDFDPDRPPGEPPALLGLASSATAVWWALVAVALVVAAVWLSHRRGDRAWVVAIGVAAVAGVVALVTLSLLPVSPLLGVSPHQLRPVWPIAIFTMVVVGAALLRSLPPRWYRLGPIVAGVLLVLAVPAHNPRSGPSADKWAMPIVRDLVAQMDPLDGSGLTLVDLSVIRFSEPYSTPVMLELQRRGIPFVTDDQIAIGQLGPTRALESEDDVVQELRIVDGGAAIEPEAGWERVAYVAGLDAEEEAELTRLRAEGRPAGQSRIRALENQRFFESAAVLVRPAP